MKINSKKEEEKDNIQFKRKYASIPTIEINRILLFRKKKFKFRNKRFFSFLHLKKGFSVYNGQK